MNEENYFKATSNLSRITESRLLRFMPRIVCNSCRRSKKQRALCLFIFLSSSKEQGNRTGNPKFAVGSFKFLRAYLALRGSDLCLMRPMVATGKVTSQPTDPLPMVTSAVCCVNAFAQSPDGRFRFGLNEYFQSK
ncbi:hypothetical protein LJC57_08510 [Parabacteroides sp. OttesenSCG-928-G07]|nr:hypothetical protein [Parabacteroides sp. OttesenSCG-928-G07]